MKIVYSMHVSIVIGISFFVDEVLLAQTTEDSHGSGYTTESKIDADRVEKTRKAMKGYLKEHRLLFKCTQLR